MAKSSASINLLQKKRDTSDIILEWALTTGRFIIIITETIALAAFAYRFTLDRQIIDLHDKIKHEQVIVSLLKNDEAKYRSLQTKLSTLKALDAQSTTLTKLTSDMVKIAEQKVILQNLSVTNSTIQISAITPTIALMNSFVNSIKQYPGVTTVSITQVENKTDTGLITISLEIKIGDEKGVISAI